MTVGALQRVAGDKPRETNFAQLAPGERWYVAYAQPHREFTAQNELAAQGFRTFLPRLRKTVRHARKLRTVTAPVFPRYLFVGLDLNRDLWRRVNGTHGVCSLVMGETLPRPVPSGVVEALGTMSGSDQHLRLGDALQVGDRVRMMAGPFAGAVGDLLRIEESGRVRVLLQLLGGAMTVSLDRLSLAPVGAS